ncbi:MAG: hypothetical protein WA579_00885, partial [Rhodomicrobium sp.]
KAENDGTRDSARHYCNRNVPNVSLTQVMTFLKVLLMRQTRAGPERDLEHLAEMLTSNARG